jgi:malate synthase
MTSSPHIDASPRMTVDAGLFGFLTTEVLPGLVVEAAHFFDELEHTLEWATRRNHELLAERDRLQTLIDDWHRRNPGSPDAATYRAFLETIGYLVPPVASFQITTGNVDAEISSTHGPQLVVPVTNARYALNAANARWGSLYDALYGTDALGSNPPSGPYDASRGALVVAWAREFLDDAVPLSFGSHADVKQYRVESGALMVEMRDGSGAGLNDADTFAGYVGLAYAPSSILLSHHGLGIEIQIDRQHPVGADDIAGVFDVRLESAVTTIVDFEDSVACVDAADKVGAYRNWLGLMRGDLRETVPKGTGTIDRTLAGDRTFSPAVAHADGAGADLVVRGRALLLARVVGHLMSTDAVLFDGQPVPEGVIDAFVISTIAMHDRDRPEALRNSATGSIYLVKPKMHGPDEVTYACDVVAAVEHALGLPPATIKLGIMDEERRTTVNLEACISAASDRIVFINTGFLDRTGDEIHTSMLAGPMVRKNDMRTTDWIRAYEDWNVDIALRCGFFGKAQIGKGMWAAPDRMADMLTTKIGHPQAGASCAWVPSPTAATLHATHYHRFDVAARQRELRGELRAELRSDGGGGRASLDQLLHIPVAVEPVWSAGDIAAELDNNLQGILGYVVRWIDAGVGCSKVPDMNDVGLMEDRATCRISSQHVANWMHHGVIAAGDVDAALRRMALVVDRQNESDPTYIPMAPGFDGAAFRAARDLVMSGLQSPSGYTEPILHSWRAIAKAQTK